MPRMYVILRETSATSPRTFEIEAMIEANDAQQAVRIQGEARGARDLRGEKMGVERFVAVPLRSFSVIERKVEVAAPKTTVSERDSAAYLGLASEPTAESEAEPTAESETEPTAKAVAA